MLSSSPVLIVVLFHFAPATNSAIWRQHNASVFETFSLTKCDYCYIHFFFSEFVLRKVCKPAILFGCPSWIW